MLIPISHFSNWWKAECCKWHFWKSGNKQVILPVHFYCPFLCIKRKETHFHSYFILHWIFERNISDNNFFFLNAMKCVEASLPTEVNMPVSKSIGFLPRSRTWKNLWAGSCKLLVYLVAEAESQGVKSIVLHYWKIQINFLTGFGTACRIQARSYQLHGRSWRQCLDR